MDEASRVRMLVLLVTLSCKLDLLAAGIDGPGEDVRRFSEECPDTPFDPVSRARDGGPPGGRGSPRRGSAGDC